MKKDGNKEDAKNFKTHYEEETDFHTCAICGKESGMNHLKKIDEKIEGYFIACGITKEFNDYLEFLDQNEVIQEYIDSK